ncbi:MAG TPA: hypothetical protein VN915_17595 [Elusimicrobiota bacterium]|nr:hypothetical protein [Elusimicrobiota bacterium]
MASRANAVAVALLLAFPWRASAAPRPVLWNNHSLIEAHTLKELPDDLRAALVGKSRLADRGSRFNSSDVVDRNLPMRRFILAGSDDAAALVAIEHGGFAYSIEVFEYAKSDGKWTQTSRRVVPRKPEGLQDLVKLMTAPKPGAKAPAPPVSRKPVIYFSEAPWDGAAYSLEIPLEKSADAPDPAIRVSLWGNPEFPDGQTIRFTGKENTGGGPGKGDGHATYQTVFNKSWPDGLAGTIVFASLVKGKPVVGSYDFTSTKGKTFKGTFTAAWGNEPPGVIR